MGSTPSVTFIGMVSAFLRLPDLVNDNVLQMPVLTLLNGAQIFAWK